MTGHDRGTPPGAALPADRSRRSAPDLRPRPLHLVLTPLTPAPGGADAGVVVRIRDPRVEEVYCPGDDRPALRAPGGPLHIATVPAGAVPIVVGLVTFPS